MGLADDDPVWDAHSGKDLHEGIEWQEADAARAFRFYSSVPLGTRVILDFLMDRPGELVDVDTLARHLRERRPGETATQHRRAVAGSLSGIRQPVQESGRRAPFYWWANGGSTWYAMKPQVARVFHDALAVDRSNTDGPKSSPAAAGNANDDWTEFEVKATVDDYLAMLAAESAGQPYIKKQHRLTLLERLNYSRSNGAVEFKHQNISAVMLRMGLPYIRGYKPRGNYQAALAQEIQRRMEADPGLFGSLRSPTAADAPTGQGLRPQQEPFVAPRQFQRGRRVDYGLLQEESRRRGELGEQLVVGYEQERLRQADCPHLADQVRWVAREDGDGLGYDILSYDADGNDLHIEVKATAYGPETPFYLSSAELDFARRHQDSYVLYRVFNLLDAPEFYVMEGNIADMLDLTPVTYRAWPQASQAPDPNADA